MSDIHRPGRSIVSGLAVFEMKRLPDGGERPVRALPETRRATLILQNGSTADVAIHADEAGEIVKPAVLRAAWARAWRTCRAEIAAAKYPNEEHRARTLEANDAIYSRPPIGVLCIRPWAENMRTG